MIERPADSRPPDPAEGRRRALRTLGTLALAASGAAALSACSSGRKGRVGQPIPPNPETAAVETGRRRATVDPYAPIAGTIARDRWARYGPNRALANVMLPPSFLTVHHDGMDRFDDHDTDAAAERLEAIRRSHVGRGWADIGYHYAIDPAGRVWQARPLSLQGAHVRANNEGNIGVLVMGNFELQSPTSSALSSLSAVIEAEVARFGIPDDHVMTHREWAPTACPGASLQAAVEKMRRGGRFAAV